MTCRGFCFISQYRIRGHNGSLEPPTVNKRAGIGPYSIQGVMFCVKCEIFFQTQGQFSKCPCCHMKMRAKGRGRHARNWRLRRRKQQQQEQQKDGPAQKEPSASPTTPGTEPTDQREIRQPPAEPETPKVQQPSEKPFTRPPEMAPTPPGPSSQCPRRRCGAGASPGDRPRPRR